MCLSFVILSVGGGWWVSYRGRWRDTVGAVIFGSVRKSNLCFTYTPASNVNLGLEERQGGFVNAAIYLSYGVSE